MPEETFESLKADMEAYPHNLNKYIHQEAREKIRKMGRLDELRDTNKGLGKVKEKVNIEDTTRFKLLKKKTVKQLKVQASELGLKFRSNILEDDLIRLILSKD